MEKEGIGVSCSCDGSNSRLSGITLKVLTDSRGYCMLLAMMERSCRGQKTPSKDSLLSMLSLRWWAGIYIEMSMLHPQIHDSHCVLSEEKKRLG